MKNNLFIAFEGIDGSGKSTQVNRLKEHLERSGHRVYCTFEPTDAPIGQMIRSIFNHKMEADHRTIAGLFVADRLDHLLNKTNGILQKMEEGFTVITDRYYFSSYAYHGAHMSMEWVIAANAQSAELLRPDLNIYIDVHPEVSMSRLTKSRDAIELYENMENLNAVRKKYFEAFELLKSQENIFITDGNRDAKEVAEDISAAVNQLL
ncbi:MAG: dTMP kinase [Saprospiraceae bacterium]|jgi:dTMP kinase|nr:dTMP kinase [Saprospiraceae bacterium]MBK7796209.1 dTMP kinase [Saprospiraceae bacterium]MBL0260408.1 dTMP kinase [Saprospiraceae bacterium]MBX7164179.1 dTMP kinase [Saprospiraceae bacterium]